MKNNSAKCKSCQKDFIIDADDLAFYEKMQVPPPMWCPQCRAIRRMVWWNEHNLYRKDGMFSTFPEASPIKIMERDAWWGDGWDPMEYGRDFDDSRDFFEQFQELLLAVPWPSRDVQKLLNSDYSNQATSLKNCYLCFNSGFCENCLYGIGSINMRDSIDYYFSGASELCYEVMDADRCYGTFFSIDVGNCRNVWLSRDCHDCMDCFGCANLRSKQYHICNQPYRKEEYLAKIKEMNLGSYGALMQAKARAYAFWKSQPYKYAHAVQNTKTIGEYVFNCKNAKQCYQVIDGENLAYCQNMARGIKDSYDYTNWGDKAELLYESVSCGENVRNLKFCFNCWPGSSDLEYCVNVMSSSNCFGCVGLKKKEYCILNKQYTPEEYEKLKCLVIQHMKNNRTYGEFFPMSMSPLAYNESIAIDYFPKTKEQAEAEGYGWREPSERNFQFTISNSQLPDNIKDVPDTITKEIIDCATCKRAYRILDRELEFYKRFELPLPRLCHNCRYTARIAWRNPMKFWKRNCAKCENEFETNYSPDRPEILYCESCYQQEVM